LIEIDEMQEMLDQLAMELPEEFYDDLNGGILLLPDKKLSREAIDGDLYTLGEYHHSHSMGRYIVIYYGSFMALYGGASKDALTGRLRSTLRHEFTHHLESLSGENELEREDERQLARYRYRAKLRRLKGRQPG
jgi:hypothetical protein